MSERSGQGWLTLRRKAQQIVLIEVPPGSEWRVIRVAVGNPEGDRIPLSIQADRDIAITREEKDEITED